MYHTKTETYFFVTIAVISLIIALLFLAPYLAVIAVSVLIAILFYPMHSRLMDWTGNRNWLATPLSFVGILITFILPFTVAATIAFQVITNFVRQVADSNIAATVSLTWFIDNGNSLLRHIPGIQYRLTADQLTNQLQQAVGYIGSHWLGSLQGFGDALFSLVPAVIIAMYVIGAIFSHYEKIGVYLHRLSPLNDNLDRLYLSRVKAMGLSMVRGTFVIALVQGLLVGLMLWVGGVQYAAFFGLLAVIVSVIPMGAGLIMLPIGVFLIATGQIWQGVLQIAGVFLLVANVDSLLRPRLVSKDASLNPALTIIGVFAGLAHFGFLGVIYGPVLMIFFVTTVEIYAKYFQPKSPTAKLV